MFRRHVGDTPFMCPRTMSILNICRVLTNGDLVFRIALQWMCTRRKGESQ